MILLAKKWMDGALEIPSPGLVLVFLQIPYIIRYMCRTVNIKIIVKFGSYGEQV